MNTWTVLVLVSLVACSLGAPQVYNHLNSKIINGENAAPGEIPYIVSMRNSSDGHHCGGSILNANWILTAGHCIAGFEDQSFTVVSGSTTLNAGGNRNNVSRLFHHEYYIGDPYYFSDIGLLQLSSPLTLSSNVQLVKLPAQDQEAASGLSVLASGWGFTYWPGTVLPNNLQKLALTLVTNEECQASFPGYFIYQTNVCTYVGSGTGTCRGDSGGPLVSSEDGVLVGIVSWGNPCAIGDPDVFTRVAKYIKWINENAK